MDLKDADAAIKQARKDIDFLAALPAQAAQQVLKQYYRAWQNWERSKEAERLRRLERMAARQRRARKPGEKTSNRLKATYDQIHGMHARFARRRADWQHQTTRVLADIYGLIGLENLNVAGMTRSAKGTVESPGRNVAQKAGLNRSIQGEARHQLHTQLAYKTAERGGTVVVVPAPHTSQRCHRCGFSDAKNRKNQADFACSKDRF